jgi:hypothetical protein
LDPLFLLPGAYPISLSVATICWEWLDRDTLGFSTAFSFNLRCARGPLAVDAAGRCSKGQKLNGKHWIDDVLSIESAMDFFD